MEAALKSTGPFAVVCAHQSQATGIRQYLADRNGGCLGVEFMSPAGLRRLFIDVATNAPEPVSDDLGKLLLAAMAETRTDDPTYRAIARGPDDLFTAIDLLIRSGHPPDAIPIPSARRLASDFINHLEDRGCATASMMDRWISKQPASDRFEALLIFGFDGSHWQHRPLLAHAARSSRSSTVCLLQPQVRSEGPDQLWINTWSQLGTETSLIDDDETTRPFSPLVERMEFGQSPEPEAETTASYLGGRDIGREADAIVEQTREWLGRPDVETIGILVPPRSLVLNEIRVRLRREELPHFDGIEQGAPVQPAFDRWHLWLDFVEDPKLPRLIAFIDSLTFVDPPDSEANTIDKQTLRDELVRAFKQVHVDDLAVIAATMDNSRSTSARSSAEWIRELPLHANAATPSAHLEQIEAAMRFAGMEAEIPTFRSATSAVAKSHDVPVSIRPFVQWLRSLPIATNRHRPTGTSHPFARVQLLPYNQAWGRTWSHLIFTGMNQHDWPPRDFESAFLKDSLVQQLNQQTIVPGPEGEGGEVVKPDHALIPTMQHRHAVQYSQWTGLLSSVGKEVAIAFARVDETRPDRHLIPSEYLTRLYHSDTGQVLNDEAIDQIVRSTGQRFGSANISSDTQRNPDVRQTGIAHTDRRCPATPFNEFLFGLKATPDPPLRLSCRAWEDAIRDPAPVWLKHVLNVEPLDRPFEESAVQQWRGIMVHRWLAKALVNNAEPGEFLQRFAGMESARAGYFDAADSTWTQMQKIFAAASREVPTWLRSLWLEARLTGAQTLEQLDLSDSFPFIATEFTLPGESVMIDFGGSGKLPVHGRLDLLMAENDAENFAGIGTAWIIDFKTGRNTSKVRADKLEESSGVQILLYGLALRKLGAENVRTSLVGPNLAPTDSFDVAATRTAQRIWKRVCEMQRTGVFGMRGALREEFTFSTRMPMATLPIDPDVLEAKSRLSLEPRIKNSDAG